MWGLRYQNGFSRGPFFFLHLNYCPTQSESHFSTHKEPIFLSLTNSIALHKECIGFSSKGMMYSEQLREHPIISMHLQQGSLRCAMPINPSLSDNTACIKSSSTALTKLVLQFWRGTSYLTTFCTYSNTLIVIIWKAHLLCLHFWSLNRAKWRRIEAQSKLTYVKIDLQFSSLMSHTWKGSMPMRRTASGLATAERHRGKDTRHNS